MATKNTHNYPTHFPKRSNLYVANLTYSADVDRNGKFRAELGKPPALDADGIVAAASINAAVTKNTSAIISHRTSMGNWGRNVTIALSGAGTPAVIVYGLDYLGQPMSETFTGNGTNAVLGKKAFKEVTSWSSDAVTSVTINIGWGNALGLPYAAGVIEDEYIDQVAAPSAGTKTVAVLTDPQTGTTGDPRGTYLPHSSYLPNGSRDYTLVCQAIEGDYHGVRHYTA